MVDDDDGGGGVTSRGARVKNNYHRRITLLDKALRLTLQKLILNERRRIRQICIAVRAKKILWWERERENVSVREGEG